MYGGHLRSMGMLSLLLDALPPKNEIVSLDILEECGGTAERSDELNIEQESRGEEQRVRSRLGIYQAAVEISLSSNPMVSHG